MKIKQLTLTQFRVFEQVTFDFHPGMNLLIGINGAGKSTVLDALRILLSQVLPKFTACKSKSIAFTARDIKFDRGGLTAEITFDAQGIAFNYLVHQTHENYIASIDEEGGVRGQTYDLVQIQDLQPDVKDIPKNLKTSSKQPLAVYFSTRRSLSSMARPSKLVSAGGQAAAFAEALSGRELRLREFVNWLLVQEALVKEGIGLAQQHLNRLEYIAVSKAKTRSK
jgi:predicted ATP-binding protein involved in virulence